MHPYNFYPSPQDLTSKLAATLSTNAAQYTHVGRADILPRDYRSYTRSQSQVCSLRWTPIKLRSSLSVLHWISGTVRCIGQHSFSNSGHISEIGKITEILESQLASGFVLEMLLDELAGASRRGAVSRRRRREGVPQAVRAVNGQVQPVAHQLLHPPRRVPQQQHGCPLLPDQRTQTWKQARTTTHKPNHSPVTPFTHCCQQHPFKHSQTRN